MTAYDPQGQHQNGEQYILGAPGQPRHAHGNDIPTYHANAQVQQHMYADAYTVGQPYPDVQNGPPIYGYGPPSSQVYDSNTQNAGDYNMGQQPPNHYGNVHANQATIAPGFHTMQVPGTHYMHQHPGAPAQYAYSVPASTVIQGQPPVPTIHNPAQMVHTSVFNNGTFVDETFCGGLTFLVGLLLCVFVGPLCLLLLCCPLDHRQVWVPNTRP
mmetsp:Transcript_24913/g.47146  ORF Transcript_24913/g.47146 Transcript_24913/m.47146 type:complete len:213 (+) Transcript_24913:319-957(+)|eukprot:CAMPEP_0114299182 /NCGR_PEP_ID=MMETSP0059-20121206/12829_1 /TAXON_ID=36894 /ORGANISM="Pyramimonas parkeae, Strain CCMP726" /LENGTH=212 /DNA_ID=CAMNT_0001421621 /DNA_START=315 /DNA_END=953 /DNA_ORIENTATION=+